MLKIDNAISGVKRYRWFCLPLMISLLLAGASLAQGQPSRFAVAYYNRGNERFKKGDMDGAIADYDAALISYPRWASAFIMRGRARYNKGDLNGSIVDFTKAIEIDPHMDQAYYNRGKAWRDKGDLEGSIEDYTRAIEINPRLSSAYNNRGNARQDKGDLDGAMADFDLAIRLDSHNAAFYNNPVPQARPHADTRPARANRASEAEVSVEGITLSSQGKNRYTLAMIPRVSPTTISAEVTAK